MHIVLCKTIADATIDATDTLSTIEANIAEGRYTSATSPTLTNVNTAHDTLMDYLNDMSSDMQGNIAACKSSCGMT